MKVAYKDSLLFKMSERIKNLPNNVILRSDVADLGGKRQVSYAIKKLIENKEIARISYGIYAKTEVSEFSGNCFLKDLEGFSGTIRETLNRLNVPWQPSEATLAYNERRSTQIPVRAILRLNKRFRRKISFNEMTFQYKKAS